MKKTLLLLISIFLYSCGGMKPYEKVDGFYWNPKQDKKVKIKVSSTTKVVGYENIEGIQYLYVNKIIIPLGKPTDMKYRNFVVFVREDNKKNKKKYVYYRFFFKKGKIVGMVRRPFYKKNK